MAIRFPIILASLLNLAGVRVFNYRTQTKCGEVSAIRVAEKIFCVSLIVLLHCLLYNKISLALRSKIGRWAHAAVVVLAALLALDTGRQLAWGHVEDRACQVGDVSRLLRHLGHYNASHCMRSCLCRDSLRCAAILLHVAAAASVLLSLCVCRLAHGRWLALLSDSDDDEGSLYSNVKDKILGVGEDGFNFMALLRQWPHKVKFFLPMKRE